LQVHSVVPAAQLLLQHSRQLDNLSPTVSCVLVVLVRACLHGFGVMMLGAAALVTPQVVCLGEGVDVCWSLFRL
jgi:hypothetical protein